MNGGNAPLRRRGVVRRSASANGGAAKVVFATQGCAGCGWGGGTVKELAIRTDLPEGTVVDVDIPPRRLLGQAARVFAPPLAAALGAAAVFGDGLSAVLGLFVGGVIAIAARLLFRARNPAHPAAAVTNGNLALQPVGDRAAN